MSNGNGYTNKELLNMVMERLNDIDKKLDAKLDKAEFYKVLGLLVAVGGVVVAALM
jgi:tetrahydromethanopterin S-methyltransferase subunit G